MIGTAARELAADLTAAGLPTGLDPRNLNPPCAYLAPRLIDYDRLDAATQTVQWELYLLAPDTEPVRALDMLTGLLDTLATVADPGEVQPVTLQLRNHSAGGLPAFLVTLTTEITKD